MSRAADPLWAASAWLLPSLAVMDAGLTLGPHGPLPVMPTCPADVTIFSAQAAFLLEHLQLMATQNQDEARQRAEAYGEQVRAQRASKRTADRPLSENLSEETRDAQRRKLEENEEAGMSADAKERQQSANKARREPARCDKCGADKTRGEYKYNQWRNRKKKLPTC